MILPYALHFLEEWKRYLETISYEYFLEHYRHAFLVTMEYSEEEEEENSNEFVTLAEDQSLLNPVQDKMKLHRVYEVKKNKRLYSSKISLGRAGNNDIVLDSSAISKFHAYFLRAGDSKYFLVDANSTNKTWVNQTQMEPSKQVEIFDRDMVTLGKNATFQFFLPSTFYSYLR